MAERIGLAECPYCQSSRTGDVFVCGSRFVDVKRQLAQQRTDACHEIEQLRADVQTLSEAYEEMAIALESKTLAAKGTLDKDEQQDLIRNALASALRGNSYVVGSTP